MMLRYLVLPSVMLMVFGSLASAVGSVSSAAAQSSNPSVMRMSPACSCSDRPKNRRHAAQIVAACVAVASDHRQPASRRLEAMKRRLKLSELIER